MDELEQGFWVFGYGSLMWTPEFEYEECLAATVSGFSRSFCMRSVHHRGTFENPGLVLALDAQADASCSGLAFRIGAGAAKQALADLRKRELISSAYGERLIPLAIEDGRTVQALAYVIDPDHELYTGALSLNAQAEIIAQAVGGRGKNSEYLFNTTEHLAKIGLEDAELVTLSQLVREQIKA